MLSRASRAAALRVVVGVLLALPLALGLAAGAQAHDELIYTDPVDGGVVASVPATVVLTFAEPPLKVGAELIVTGPDGAAAAAGRPTVVGSTVRQAIRSGSPAGRYTVAWRVTSDDGHPVSGAFAFTASAPSAGGPTQAAGRTPSAAPSLAPSLAPNLAPSLVSGPAVGEPTPATQRRNLLPIVLLGSVVLLFVLVVAVVIAAQTRRDRLSEELSGRP